MARNLKRNDEKKIDPHSNERKERRKRYQTFCGNPFNSCSSFFTFFVNLFLIIERMKIRRASQRETEKEVPHILKRHLSPGLKFVPEIRIGNEIDRNDATSGEI
jgi:hypothetical protein